MPLRQQDVARLDVAVDDALSMSVVQRVRHFARDAKGLGSRDRAAPHDAIPERLPFDVRHHVVQEPVGFTRIVERQDVRVLQPGRDLDLSKESLRADRLGELRTQDLDGDGTLVLQVRGQVDRSHAALAELVFRHGTRRRVLP